MLKKIEQPSLLSELPTNIFTLLIRRFPDKKLERKIELLEFMIKVINQIMSTNKTYYHYNNVVEDSDSIKSKLNKKEKEIIIEILEYYFPPERRDLGELRGNKHSVYKQKKLQAAKLQPTQSNPNLKPAAKLGSSNSTFKETNSTLKHVRIAQKESSTSKYRASHSRSPSASVQEASSSVPRPLEDCIRISKRRVPEIKKISKLYELEMEKSRQSYELINMLTCTILQNYSINKIEQMLGEKIYDIIDISKLTDDVCTITFSFAASSIVIKNMKSNDLVLYHAITNFKSFSSLTHLEIVNTHIPPYVIAYLLLIVSYTALKLESIVLDGAILDCDLNNEAWIGLFIILAMNPNLKKLHLTNCSLTTKSLPKFVSNLVNNKCLEEVILDGNKIDRYGIGFLKSLGKYKESLKLISIKHNELQSPADDDVLNDILTMATARKNLNIEF